jgi:cytochrome c553
MRKLVSLIAWAAIVSAAPWAAASAEENGRGAQLFQLCAQCHGESGEGMQLALAPAIAGLDRWYVEAQVEKFRSGVRGVHPDDLGGLRMYPMSLALKTTEEVKAVAAYVASLPPAHPEPTLEGGDAARGKVLFTPCVACHGPEAAGNEQLGAPPLTRASDWYLLTQLRNFQAGVRGGDPVANESAGRMRPMAILLTDEQAMKDVLAHIMTLPD